MKQSKKQYWKGVEELNPSPEFLEDAKNEFPEKIIESMEGEEGTTRRDFLKTLGFGMAAVSLAACEAPVRKAIPYLNKPETIDPGTPNYYASTYMSGGDYCSVVVKTREGRPIKVEGNLKSSMQLGGTNARVQASVLSLYDEDRLTGPYEGEKETTWKKLDAAVTSALASANSVALISNTIISPSTKGVIADLKSKYSGVKHVTYDPVSYSGMLEANKAMYGKYALPSLDFGKAECIVSFGADFLGTWISDIEYTKQYSKGKKISNQNKKMSRHYQFESIMTMTGANADYRAMIKPSEQGKAIAALYSALGGSGINAGSIEKNDKFNTLIKKAANDLKSKGKGKTLVVADSNNVEIQKLVNRINEMLGNYGSTVDINKPSYQRQGNDAEMNKLVSQLGSNDVVIFLDCNPVYNHSKGKDIANALKNVKMSVSTAVRKDETAKLCKFVAPDNHYLESWNDAEPKQGVFSLAQPTISQLFKTRQSAQSLLVWSGSSSEYVDVIRENWKKYLMPLQESSNIALFEDFWNQSLHDGVMETSKAYSSIHLGMMAAETNEEVADVEEGEDMMMDEVVEEESSSMSGAFSAAAVSSAISAMSSVKGDELIKYQKVAIGQGDQLNNPWLHECPDPVTKACWGDYVSMSRTTADRLNVTQDDVVTLFDGKQDLKLPVLVQPGQADDTFAIAYGYGAMGGKTMGLLNGINAYQEGGAKLSVKPTGETYKIAQTQTHQTYFGRESVVQESTLEEYQDTEQFAKDRFSPEVTAADGIRRAPKEFDMYDKYDYNNHHWGLVVDMNSCTGCSACVVACVAENNIPVVGRKEVINRRDMHWMRIDRYYSHNPELYDMSKSGNLGDKKTFGMDEDEERILAAALDPEVVFQPMMCQHCNHASCENVCPVAATTHSTEGLNMMAYNRCIGTRYCANNCAYKVRRFNWFNYADNDDVAQRKGFSDTNPVLTELGRMVLNPDVVVRFRGVMEKCTMCVQRIQYGKLEAKKAGRKLNDGEFDSEGRRQNYGDIATACQQACPADAITFGDKNDADSEISRMIDTKNGLQKERRYEVLEEVNTQPNIHYLVKVRNKDKEVTAAKPAAKTEA